MGTNAIEAGETPFDFYPSSFEVLFSSSTKNKAKKRGEISKNERETSKNKGETSKNERRNYCFIPKSENK
ncbi:hypothetical protein E1A91_D07G166400v1 [Gossypium mustelinum]|uniref:Uncharacterized protein n=3 Tax=Gossypium TaxID=3633 RepID=A0A5J5QRK0_GOSBA|nr:hypothetical protein ES319_D07G162800v1 [Gossypium barbadense]TYH63165.1 hypothetical protein ES332_D07G171200v1 [Gossypium tomentosum]TYI73970.1 hypothetical protein E1A91_D07G166400v1 [Gossypium mustelinum]